jgi:hypothetical protein
MQCLYAISEGVRESWDAYRWQPLQSQHLEVAADINPNMLMYTTSQQHSGCHIDEAHGPSYTNWMHPQANVICRLVRASIFTHQPSIFFSCLLADCLPMTGATFSSPTLPATLSASALGSLPEPATADRYRLPIASPSSHFQLACPTIHHTGPIVVCRLRSRDTYQPPPTLHPAFFQLPIAGCCAMPGRVQWLNTVIRPG